jgi:Dimethlysulfonioproprionate lyase
MPRTAQLKNYLNTLRAAFDQSDSVPEVMAVVQKVFQALQNDEGLPRTTPPKRLPVCGYLTEAEMPAQKASRVLSELVRAFNDVEPEINWAVRTAGGLNASDNWPENHANGMIFGPGGVEERSDVMMGASLLAPNVRYPDHSHPPEEIYLVLTPGRFQHGSSDWFTPGVGGTLHNVPSIKHAMASGDTPFLALWCLLLKP